MIHVFLRNSYFSFVLIDVAGYDSKPRGDDIFMDEGLIIKAIDSRDGQAMVLLIEEYSRLLWAIAGAILKNSASDEDVEECVSDVFLHLWLHPKDFDSMRGNLKGYLALLTKSKALDRLRKVNRTNTVSLDDDLILESEDILAKMIAKEEETQLIQAVRSLEEPNREIFIRRFFFEQKPSEISKALSLPVRQVENRLYRSKLRLQQLAISE